MLAAVVYKMHSEELDNKCRLCVGDIREDTKKYNINTVWINIYLVEHIFKHKKASGNYKCPNCKGFGIQTVRPKLRARQVGI